ncbi:hypothetical protein HID58_026716 [Brassica napus]|uniref:Uncharacterized protein n=1 Tax=Brassica napus TaxID=3708 RepID=A0ABQ8CRX6_BRANA|nr:hypothetical protein HID58_026716 [Brassica napus]
MKTMGIFDDSSKTLWGSMTLGSSRYALNGKIMLASVIILFVAVILILCFHSYARWLFRRQNRRIRRRINAHLRSLSAARDPTQSSSLSPLDPAVLEKIPIFSVTESGLRNSEPVAPVFPSVKPIEDTEAGSSSSSDESDSSTPSSSSGSPLRFPMEACEREPSVYLLRFPGEIDASNSGLPGDNGSNNRVSMKRIWGI